MTGSCLCGGVRFAIAAAVGPFELCHCRRCRKVSGSAFAAMLGVRTADFRWLAGRELVTSFEAALLVAPPPYRTSFCWRCGSRVPDPEPPGDWFEVPAGLLDDDPGLRPDKHILVELKAPWYDVADALPQLDRAALVAWRRAHRRMP